jgi:signal transduction histidine kinase
MAQRHITPQNIFRVLIGGFSLVIVLLLGAAYVGVRNIQSIQQNAANLVREQSVTNGLIDELHEQQTSLSAVLSVLARDPDSVDYDAIMSQLDAADRDIDRISAEGAQTAERDLWSRLRQSSMDFSREARRLLRVEDPQTYASLELFRAHGAFVSVAARLIESEYRKVSAAQGQIDRRSSRLLEGAVLVLLPSVALALVFAALTIGTIRRLTLALEQQAEDLSRVSWHMLADQEASARRFSHELHDELGQELTAMKTNLTALEADNGVNRERLRDCLRLADESIGNVRQMSQLLHPTILDDFGLEAGIRWLCESFATRTGIEVQARLNYSGRLPEQTETHLFRIAQEALTNIARHSGANWAEVKLESIGGEIHLSVRDNGRGLSQAAMGGHRGLGMTGMRARARSAGGDVTVHPNPGQGVVIEVRVPIRHEAHSNSSG